jgi:hypothetical protein
MTQIKIKQLGFGMKKDGKFVTDVPIEMIGKKAIKIDK